MMEVTIKVEGEIVGNREKIGATLDVPDNWKPTFTEWCKAKGAIRMLVEKFDQHFCPRGKDN